MRHATQKTIVANKIKALLVNGNVKEAVEYANKKGVTPLELGEISKKTNW